MKSRQSGVGGGEGGLAGLLQATVIPGCGVSSQSNVVMRIVARMTMMTLPRHISTTNIQLSGVGQRTVGGSRRKGGGGGRGVAHLERGLEIEL